MISSSKTHLTVAIADLIISEGLYFNLAQKPRLKKVLYLASNLPKGYNPPDRKLISKYLLGDIHDYNTKRNLTMINNEADIFGFFFLGGGATIPRNPLLNILVSGKNLPVEV